MIREVLSNNELVFDPNRVRAFAQLVARSAEWDSAIEQLQVYEVLRSTEPDNPEILSRTLLLQTPMAALDGLEEGLDVQKVP